MSVRPTPGISADRLVALLAPAARHVDIRVVAETGSTNVDLLQAAKHLTTPTLLWAQSQTAGKGRAGRTWVSAADATLTFSLAWKFDRPLHALIGLPLAVGVAIAEALSSLAVSTELKWPNDILRDGKKLGGILIETVSTGSSTWAVIGIGLNLSVPDNLDAAVAQAAASAPELCADRERTMAALLNALAEGLPIFTEQGLSAFVSRWNALHAHAGKAVSIVDRATVLHRGTAIGIDESGRLQLDTDQGRVAIIAGDISLRAIKTQGSE